MQEKKNRLFGTRQQCSGFIPLILVVPNDLKADDLGVWKHKGKPVGKQKLLMPLNPVSFMDLIIPKKTEVMITHSQEFITIIKISRISFFFYIHGKHLQ